MVLKVVKIVTLIVALIVALMYGPEIVHALWAAAVWLFHHPWVGGPVLVASTIFGPIVIAGSMDDEW